MCQLGDIVKLIPNVQEQNGLIGYRGFYIRNFNTNRILSGLNYDKECLPVIGQADEKPNLGNLNGLWSYNYNNNYNYYYNNYNYNNYNYYYVAAKILSFGTVVEHKLGYRAEQIRVTQLMLLTPKTELDKQFNNFLEYFNQVVTESAKLYEAETINHVDFK